MAPAHFAAMMEVRELAFRFERHFAYRYAPSWRKLVLNPRRVFSNRLRKYGLVRSRPGTLRVVAAFHAPQFTVVSGESVSEEIAGYGIYEPNLTAALLRLIKPGDTVVDIGMHLGYYTVLFALLVGERGHVHAFEPTPSTRELARQNVDRFRQVTVHPKAVWSEEQELAFQDYGPRWMAFNSFTAARMENFQEPAEKFTVESTSLDAFRRQLGQRISLVKIDAESAERQIISGAFSLLHEDGPIVTLEVGDFEGQTSSRELIRLLEAQGYRPWEFEGGKFEKHLLRSTYTYDNLLFAPERIQLCEL
jgi:FkbM family methyltransferase